jgi:hypothetical protein
VNKSAAACARSAASRTTASKVSRSPSPLAWRQSWTCCRQYRAIEHWRAAWFTVKLVQHGQQEGERMASFGMAIGHDRQGRATSAIFAHFRAARCQHKK